MSAFSLNSESGLPTGVKEMHRETPQKSGAGLLKIITIAV
jgi:hypothetical protein